MRTSPTRIIVIGLCLFLLIVLEGCGKELPPAPPPADASQPVFAPGPELSSEAYRAPRLLQVRSFSEQEIENFVRGHADEVEGSVNMGRVQWKGWTAERGTDGTWLAKQYETFEPAP